MLYDFVYLGNEVKSSFILQGQAYKQTTECIKEGIKKHKSNDAVVIARRYPDRYFVQEGLRNSNLCRRLGCAGLALGSELTMERFVWTIFGLAERLFYGDCHRGRA